MTFIVSVVVGLVCGLLGFAVGQAAAPTIGVPEGVLFADLLRSRLAGVDWPMFGAGIGILGGVSAVQWLRRGKRRRGARFWHGLAASALIAAALLGGQQLRLYAFQRLGLNVTAPSLEFEIRLPPQAPPPHDLVQIELQTEFNQAIAALKPDWLGADGSRPIVRARVALDFRANNRTIVLLLPDEPARLFRLRLNPAPRPMADYSGWQQVDEIEDAGTRRKPEPRDDYAIRYRVY
jgi:hypothetical protein